MPVIVVPLMLVTDVSCLQARGVCGEIVGYASDRHTRLGYGVERSDCCGEIGQEKDEHDSDYDVSERACSEDSKFSYV